MNTHGVGVYVLLRGKDSTARHRVVREACVSLSAGPNILETPDNIYNVNSL
jgi:hypothetical protein